MFNSIWYQNLIKPDFSLPDWVFAPVWAVLYVLIFLALAFYINSEGENKNQGYTFFIMQMLLNIIWTPVFFGMKSILGGLVIIILLDIFVFLTMYKFFQSSKIAGFLLLPYFIWLIFATYLNIGYFILNKF